jgi:hypothetical protein
VSPHPNADAVTRLFPLAYSSSKTDGENAFWGGLFRGGADWLS